MVTQTYTVAYKGIEAIPVTVQVQMASALPAFNIVGLADKAVSEARERVRAALNSCGLALPAQRILVNLAPADLPKEGGHYDLPIALGMLAALNIIPASATENIVSMGELSLDGSVRPVCGALSASLTAASLGKDFLCSPDNALEASWSEETNVYAIPDLKSLINHLAGNHPIAPLAINIHENMPAPERVSRYDLAEVRGQETAKRALEITASGGHNLLMSGSPGAGKSMLASILPDILPPLSPAERLESSLIASITGNLSKHGIQVNRPYRNPHHSASMAALIGGGRKAMPGEISLAHAGVLFLDELPEFKSDVLDSLRQPLETGQAVIARAEHHVTYPASFQLVAAMNPCKCGYLSDPRKACHRAPKCGEDYVNRLSGPLLDRFDIRIELSPVSIEDLSAPLAKETSQDMYERVCKVRLHQEKRSKHYADISGVHPVNARITGKFLESVTQINYETQKFLARAADKLALTARGYHRILRVARTIQDMDDCSDNLPFDQITEVGLPAIAEALAFRMV